MAAAVFATVTVTATPPPTTVFVTASPIIETHHVTATETYTRHPTGDDGVPLYLIPPFPLGDHQTETQSPSLPVMSMAASSTPRSNPTPSLLPFPNGAAPLLPDPLGIGQSPWYYNPGPSILLNCIAIAAIIKLYLTPSHQPQHKVEQPTGSGSKEISYQRLVPRLLRRIIARIKPILRVSGTYILQLAAIAGFNLAAWDLVTNYIAMERLRRTSNTTWVFHAGQLGPPITVITWGLTAAIWRTIVFLIRVCTKLPDTRTIRQPNGRFVNDGPERSAAKVRLAQSVRQLGLEGLGLVLPSSAAGILLLNKWMWIGCTTSESRGGSVVPADFMPGMYWEGIADSIHSVHLVTTAAAGLWLVLTSALALLAADWDFLRHCHKQVERHVCRDPLWKLWLAYWAIFAVSLVLALFDLFYLFTGIGVGLHNSLESQGEMWVACSLWLLAPWAVALFFMGMPSLVLCSLGMSTLWYALRGWVFRVIDVRRSCFFMPCSGKSTWERDQLLMVFLGLGLVGCYWRQIRRRGARQSDLRRRLPAYK
ncbi:hypothetical protein B0T25DRAFT_291960 [Lasiosphaeria hispida]|uniref:Uncharacterized protein n=1 Tax=Lasiosphaeria hispida TaxID=260671 RepID=A0AAJ0HC96_9PEZI|nr:hypothetical protein B0T25DRAFT_291960 [Lasiosphaeria hispida]